MQNTEHDETDRRLIHALQINPRARWTALAPIVGVDSVTLARRWGRLVEEGLAWVTGYPGPARQGPAAILEVECHPSAKVSLAAEFAADSESFTVDLTTGGRDILVLIAGSDMGRLTSYLLERMQGMKGIRATRTHLVSSAFTEAGRWRIRALAPAEVNAVEKAVLAAPSTSTRVDPNLEAGLLRELGLDGRASVSTIAHRLDVSQRRVRDALSSAIGQDRLILRTDMAKTHSGWPIHAWYFLKLPAASVERVGSALGRVGEIRFAVSAVGQYNLVLAAWMRTLADVQRLEVAIEEKLPGANIADRSVVLRTVKNLGHQLDEFGRSTGVFIPAPIAVDRPQLPSI